MRKQFILSDFSIERWNKIFYIGNFSRETYSTILNFLKTYLCAKMKQFIVIFSYQQDQFLSFDVISTVQSCSASLSMLIFTALSRRRSPVKTLRSSARFIPCGYLNDKSLTFLFQRIVVGIRNTYNLAYRKNLMPDNQTDFQNAILWPSTLRCDFPFTYTCPPQRLFSNHLIPHIELLRVRVQLLLQTRKQ